MTHFLKSYRHLTSLAAVIVLAICLALLGASPIACALFVGVYQLSRLAMSRPRRNCFFETTGLTPEQLKEFESILGEFKDIGKLIPGLKDLGTIEGGFAVLKKLPELLKSEQTRNDELSAKFKKLEKRVVDDQQHVKWVNGIGFVSEDCAKYLGSMFVLKAVQDNKLKGAVADSLFTRAAGILGLETKAAIAATDIPLPTIVLKLLRWKIAAIMSVNGQKM